MTRFWTNTDDDMSTECWEEDGGGGGGNADLSLVFPNFGV